MKNVFRLALALALGIVIGAAGTALAEGEVVQATFAKFDYVVNGDPVNVEADALVYQGSTYLPVRALLNALGYDVTYVAATKTIKADKPIETLLEEMKKAVKSNEDVSGVMTLDEIDHQIRITETMLRAARGMLASAQETGDEEYVQKLEQYIVENEQKLIDLRNQRSALAESN